MLVRARYFCSSVINHALEHISEPNYVSLVTTVCRRNAKIHEEGEHEIKWICCPSWSVLN